MQVSNFQGPQRVDFFYDFRRTFKNGRVAAVEVLHWYTVEGNPKAVVLVIDTDEQGLNPQGGEILKIGLGPEFFADLRFVEAE